MKINKATDTSLTGAITTIASNGLELKVTIPPTTLIAVVIAIIITISAGYAIGYAFYKLH